MIDVKIRYNTNAKSEDDLHWRVLIDSVEYLAHSVSIEIPCHTTKDIVDVGEKWHISCLANSVIWKDNQCTIK